MFTELSNPDSPARKRPLYIVGLMCFCSFVGCLIRLVLNVYLQIPLSICTALACVILFLVINKIKINFPPAGAILLIPMILDEKLLLIFPLEVFVGAFVLAYSSIFMFRKKSMA